VPAPSRLTIDELRALDGRRTAIVDTRDWNDFRRGHIPGALSLPLLSSFPTDAGSLVSEREEIVLIVRPERLDEATRELIRIGLDRVVGWFDESEMKLYDGDGRRLASIDQITAEEAQSLVGGGRVKVLDVRRMTEYEEGHIPGAINIAHTRLRDRLEEAPAKDERTLVHCRLGFRSSRASSLLAREGYDVVNLEGGFVAWEQLESTKSTA
jgi:hydroxyacylglutathione hydrolase